jgi:hypothetical protein
LAPVWASRVSGGSDLLKATGRIVTLLPGQISLHRIEAPLDDLADDVRGNELYSPA